MKIKPIDFRGILRVLTEEVEYAKSIKIKREDFDGEEKECSISDIQFSTIFMETIDNQLHNGFIEDEASYSVISNSMITIWINNEKKVFRGFYANSQIPLNPENIRILIREYIYEYITSSFDDYAISKVKNNKHYVCVNPQGNKSVSVPKMIRNVDNNLLAQLRKISRRTYTREGVRTASLDLNVVKTTKVIADSFGTEIIESRDIFNLSSVVNFFTSNGTMANPFAGQLYSSVRKLRRDLVDFEKRINASIDDVDNTIEIDSGIVPILMDPQAVHVLFHEGIGAHMFGGDFIANQDSRVFENKIGADIAYNTSLHPLKDISVFCEPNKPGFVASYLYDNEGTRSRDVCLLERGVVRNYLTCLNSAKRLNLEPGGHALAESFVAMDQLGRPVARSVQPRISNLIVKSHTRLDVEDLRREIEVICKEDGLPYYLETCSKGGEVDVATGSFKLFLSDIKAVYPDGTKKNVLSGVLSGDMFSFISAIAAITKNYGDSTMRCGSASGWVPTHGRAPYMLLYGINFSPVKPPEKEEDYSPSRDKYIPAEE